MKVNKNILLALYRLAEQQKNVELILKIKYILEGNL